MTIQTETEFLAAARKLAEFDELVLRRKRAYAQSDFLDVLLAESVLAELEGQRRELHGAMIQYDRRVNGDRCGPWMPISDHRRFWLTDPRPGDFDIGDIASALARVNRFNGRIRGDHYSVAQHSVLVSRLLPDRYKLFGLLHDAPEAYYGDVISPVKRLVRNLYVPLEHTAMWALSLQYGFADQFRSESAKYLVKRADQVMAATEARDVFALGYVIEPLTESPLDAPIVDFWEPARAQAEFLLEFGRLTCPTNSPKSAHSSPGSPRPCG